MLRGCRGLLLSLLLLVPVAAARADECALLPDSAPCNDGLFCNGLDFCVGGTCSGHAGDPCVGGPACAATCDEAGATCADPAGTPCGDDGNPCTADVCDGSGACVHPAGNDGASCDDGQFCNGADTCAGGGCVHAGNPCAGAPECANTCDEIGASCLTPAGTACGDDGNPCTDDVCDGAGACVHPSNTAPCNDGRFCTVNDVCSGGACGGTPRDCSGAGDVCNAGVCNEAANACQPAPLPAGTSCDDGVFCNGADTCNAGACVHAGNPCPGPNGNANCAESCDEAAKTCTAPDPEGSPCNDGQFCTVNDRCHGGVCQGKARDCSSAGNACNDGVCNESTNACEASPKPNGTPCTDDGLFCNGAEVCSGGACTHAGNPCAGGPECANTCNEAAKNCFASAGTACTSDGNPCTNDRCDGAGACTHPNNSAPCDDGIFCNGADTCGGGACSVHAGNPCPGPDGDANCAESCNEAGKTCTAPDPEGSACNDGQVCTVNDRCHGGVCQGTARDCSSAGNACNDGVCNESTNACEASPKPNGTPCTDDGLFCNGTEVCSGGACTHAGNPCAGGPECARTCNEAVKNCFASAGTTCTGDGNPCTNDRCDGAGACTHPNNSAPCDDGIFCNGADTCSGGSCSLHVGNPCPGPDGDGNCAESCNEAANNCTAPDPDGSPCNDGNACTRTDTCQGGSCHGGNPVVCTAKDDCHTVGACDTGTGVCSNPIRPDGSTCDDGNACTKTDRCQAGSCTGTNAVVCTALDQCHDVGACDHGSGVCSQPAKADGTACNDGDACTRTDVCIAGACTGSNPVVCDTADPCVGTCDRATGACTNNVRPDGAACNDGNLCTLRDTCHGGACIAGPPVVCVRKDQCHRAGTCATATGICSDPPAPDGSACDDANVCTTGDVCRAGVCGGVRVPAPRCCLADTECNDGITCTADRCVANSCVGVPMDDRCGGGGQCLAPACVPGDPAAGSDGCVLRAGNDNTYCSEDRDPCTIDACRAGDCTHEPDGSGSTCPRLAPPFETALGLLARTTDMRAAVEAVVTCVGAGGITCQAATGDASRTRLLTLVDSVGTDLQAAILALGGRLAAPRPDDATRDPMVRARVASGLVAGTPGTVRAFLATLRAARSARAVNPAFARAQRSEGHQLLVGTNKLRRQLQRILFRRGSFVR